MSSRERLAQINAAIAKIETGGQEYQMGRMRLVRADLARLYEERRNLAAEIARENGGNAYVAVFEGR